MKEAPSGEENSPGDHGSDTVLIAVISVGIDEICIRIDGPGGSQDLGYFCLVLGLLCFPSIADCAVALVNATFKSVSIERLTHGSCGL